MTIAYEFHALQPTEPLTHSTNIHAYPGLALKWTGKQEHMNTVCKCMVDTLRGDRTRCYEREKQGAYFKKRTMKIEEPDKWRMFHTEGTIKYKGSGVRKRWPIEGLKEGQCSWEPLYPDWLALSLNSIQYEWQGVPGRCDKWIRKTKAGKLYHGLGVGSGGGMFSELARSSVLLELASDKWLNLEVMLKILIVFGVRKGMNNFKQWR